MKERGAVVDAGPRAGLGAGVIPACLFAWFLPGAGHLYLGRRAKGFVFMGCLSALFVLGVLMESRLELHLGFDDPLALIVSVAQMALGLPYLVARALGFSEGAVKAVTYEYGTTFTAVAGLLNILVILDAHDIATGRKP
ncbi:MAG TPA: DUF6677 family protein [Vicinamibacteria bacterium]|nr:DUF6677 family protein [Vicinamibacteria bacterium]